MSQVGDLSRLLAFQPQYKAMDTEIKCDDVTIVYFFVGWGEGLTIWVVPIVLKALALNLCLKTVRFAHDVRRLNYVHVLMCPKGSWSV